jgi:hypothetical protein
MKGTRGITLVALVITIVVLLILAGVAINFALADNGIIKKTSQATEAHKKAQLEEQLNLELIGIKMDMMMGNNYTLEDIATMLGGTVNDGKILVEREGYSFTIEGLTITDVSLASMEISFSPNGVEGIQIVNTVLKVENKNGEVDPSSLQYGWSNAKDIRPTEWTSFTSGQTITKDITAQAQVYYVWIKARDTQGNEQIKRSNQFNDIDTANPTIVGTVTNNGELTQATVDITVTYGFSGLEKVKWLKGTKTQADFTSEGNELTKISDTTYRFIAPENGTYTAYVEGKNGNKAVVVKTVTALVVGPAAWENDSNLIAIITDDNRRVPMPVGFTQVTSAGNSIAGGIVIADTSNGNEFVWVPCTTDGAGGTVKYEKWVTTGEISHTNTTDDTIPTKVTSTWGQTEVSQITKYKGFYIARYEAGIPASMTGAISSTGSRNVSGTPVSKKNSVPWTNINYTNAKENAERMYNSSTYIQSGLVTGKQWDTVMKWLQNSGKNISSNSISWGNYKNAGVTNVTQYSTNDGAAWTSISSTTKGTTVSWQLKTGHSEYTKANNIYDLAGNLSEWTNENYSTYKVYRGR